MNQSHEFIASEWQKIVQKTEVDKLIISRNMTDIPLEKWGYFFIYACLAGAFEYLTLIGIALFVVFIEGDLLGKITTVCICVFFIICIFFVRLYRLDRPLKNYCAAYDHEILIAPDILSSIRTNKMEWVVIDRRAWNYVYTYRIHRLTNIFFTRPSL